MGAESILSKALNGGMSRAFNEDAWGIAKGYLNTFKDTMKRSGIGDALLGSSQGGARSGGLISDFMRFAGGQGLSAPEDILARKIGSYGGAAVLGAGAAVGAYSLATKGIGTAGDTMQSHPGATALAIGGSVWAATAGKGTTQKIFNRAQSMAAAGLGYASRAGMRH